MKQHLTALMMVPAMALMSSTEAHAQTHRPMTSGEIAVGVRRLGVVGNVLYVAAHPDDENTRLLTWLVGARGVRAAYLSLTRGDGGQNLVGAEQDELLGLLRTHELLAARRIDGAEQLFTRMRDFGYSKSAEETLRIWDKEEALSDVVLAIQLPPGREKIDWECELSVVIGKTATRVPLDKATDYIFGYTLENDVSDRGGRGDRRHGSDWLIGKGHDTFAPMGPFIVPKQFVKDPQKLALTFTLNGKVMQDSNTDRMTHTAVEMVSFGSHILTLRAGDVIALGSPAGVGTARETPIYFKAGDTAVCTIESIGTLTNPIVAAAPSPSTH